MRFRHKFSSYLITIFFLLSIAGCKTLEQPADVSLKSQAISSERFFNLSSDGQTSKDLESFLLKYKDKQCGERDKIDYLIKAVENSRLTFIRNGESYSSDKAAKWLRWKMHHPQYNDDPIDSADEFVNRVASGSVNTGLSYKLILSNGQYVDADVVLARELQLLEAGLEQYAKTRFHPAA